MEVIKPDYLRVTEILGVFQDFSMIMPEVLEAACERGTEAHQAIEDYLDMCFVSDNPYLQSFLKWEEIVKAKVISTEQRFYDDMYKITGQIDLIYQMDGDKENEVNIMDFKTPVAKGKTWGCQLAAYKMLVERNTKQKVKRLFSLRLKKDGSLPSITEYTEKIDTHTDIFICALKAYRHLK